MIVYETDGQQVIENLGWFVPLHWDSLMEDFAPFIGTDGWEIQFSILDQAINYLAGK